MSPAFSHVENHLCVDTYASILAVENALRVKKIASGVVATVVVEKSVACLVYLARCFAIGNAAT